MYKFGAGEGESVELDEKQFSNPTNIFDISKIFPFHTEGVCNPVISWDEGDPHLCSCSESRRAWD